MSGRLRNPALLGNLGGNSLPPVALNVAAEYQPCVDAGAAAAVSFFDDITVVGLHDHIALSMHLFSQSARACLIATHDHAPAKMQAITDAFAAGYLGRIQQELRLFHGEDARQRRPENGPAIHSHH